MTNNIVALNQPLRFIEQHNGYLCLLRIQFGREELVMVHKNILSSFLMHFLYVLIQQCMHLRIEFAALLLNDSLTHSITHSLDRPFIRTVDPLKTQHW